MELQKGNDTSFTWFCPHCEAHGYANGTDIYIKWISVKGIPTRIQFIKCMSCHAELQNAVPKCFENLGVPLNKRGDVEDPMIKFPE